MKQLKILTLAMLAVAALMASVGSSSAAATETSLCKLNTTTFGIPICQEAHLYKAGTAVQSELETFLLIEAPFGNVECEESTLKFVTEKTTAIPLGATVEAFTFGKCGGASVSTTENGTLDIEIIDLPVWTHNGTLTFTGTKIKVTKGTIECIYSVGHSGTLTGGATATIDLQGTLTKVGGNKDCPAGNATWIGFYKVKSPAPLWVST